MAGLLAPDKGDVFVKGVRRQGLASDDDAAGKCAADPASIASHDYLPGPMLACDASAACT